MRCTSRRLIAAIALWCAIGHTIAFGGIFAMHKYLNNSRQHQYVIYQCTLLSHGSVNTEQVSPLFVKMKSFYRIYWPVHYRDNVTEHNSTLVTPWVQNKADLAPYLHLPPRSIVDCWGPPQDYELISASPNNWPNPLRAAQAQMMLFVSILGAGTVIAFGAFLIYALSQYSMARAAARMEYISLNRAGPFE